MYSDASWIYYYYYYYYYLLQLSCNSVAVVLTLVQTKQIRINIQKRNNTNTQYKQHKRHSTQVHILPKHPPNCKNTPHMASSKTDKNEVVTDGVYFFSALLGDPSMNDSKLMIVLSFVCLSVPLSAGVDCVCRKLVGVYFIFRHAVLFWQWVLNEFIFLQKCRARFCIRL
jgi:hypothetical protein